MSCTYAPCRRPERPSLRWPSATVVSLLLACSGGTQEQSPLDGRSADQTAELHTRGELRATDSPGEVAPGEPVPLILARACSHTVVLQEGHSPSEATAAQELIDHVRNCSGAELPLVTGGPVGDGPLIVIGQGPVAAGLGVAPTSDELGAQGYVLRTIPPNIVIAGTPAAGTMYGIHRFLEEFLGVRWYAPGVTRFPDCSDVVIPPLDRLEEPAFLWRHTSYAWPGQDDAFMARQGGNAGKAGADGQWGLQYSFDGMAHSYFWYLSPDEFFDEHPDYFSEVGGVRLRDDTQLCLTNPEVLEIVTERMLQRMADKPHARQHNFSQQDHYNYCQCEKCSAMNEKYQTNGGTQFWFVGELAARTARLYPDKQIGTLAYMYTEEPPVGLELHPNVAVWLCHMYPSCDSHPIATCPDNADYRRRAESWSQLTGHLYIWHYIVDFTHYYNPFPNFDAMAADMRFYRDLGVEGIFLQGMGHGGGGGEFSLLRPWYGMKLLFDPDLDPFALRRDFLQGYYGAAAPAIEEYIQKLHAKVADEQIHMHLYTNPGQGYLTNQVVEQAGQLFDQAEAAVANDSELLERVRVARMPLTYARLFPRNGYWLEGGKLHWGQPIATGAEVKEFLDRMAAHGFATLREVGGDPSLMILLAAIFQSPVPVKSIANGQLQVEIVPQLGGRALRLIHLPSGQEVTASNIVPNLFFPFAGGLEDRIGGSFEAYGWVEPAAVATADPLKVTLTQSTLNGYAVSRSFELDPSEPRLRCTTTITNASGSRREDRFRFHVELNPGPPAESSVTFTDRQGLPVTVPMEQMVANQREGIHYYSQEAPDGQWTITGPRGLRIVQSFSNEQIDHTWVYSFPESLGELELELWTEKLDLEPGASATFEHQLSVEPEDG